MHVGRLEAAGSVYLTRPTLRDYIAERGELLRRASDVLRWVADGSLTIRIGARYALEDAARAHDADALLSQGSFLRTKFSGSDLDL